MSWEGCRVSNMFVYDMREQCCECILTLGVMFVLCWYFSVVSLCVQLLGKPEVVVQTEDQQGGIWHRGSSSLGTGEWLVCKKKNPCLCWRVDAIWKKVFLILCFPPFSSAVHVHNDFLLAILTRCQIIVSTPGTLNIYIFTSCMHEIVIMLKLFYSYCSTIISCNCVICVYLLHWCYCLRNRSCVIFRHFKIMLS